MQVGVAVHKFQMAGVRSISSFVAALLWSLLTPTVTAEDTSDDSIPKDYVSPLNSLTQPLTGDYSI